MCNPMAIAAGVAMVGGAYAQHRGQVKAEEAGVNVRRAEDARQKGYEQKAEDGLKKNMQAVDAETIGANNAANTAAREAAYKQQAMQAPHAAEQAASGAMGGNQVVADNLTQALSRQTQQTDAIGSARAQLGAFGDTMFDTSILTGRGRQEINQAGDFAQHSLQPVDAELGVAAHKGDKLKNLGTILQIAGAAMSAGAGSAAAGGSTAASTGAGATTWTGLGTSLAGGAGSLAAGAGATAAGASSMSWLAPMLSTAAQYGGTAGQPNSDPYLRRSSYIGPQ